uniref:Uncharacterized protein n=1 Tax=viral metagenome TaxID=1070528 RepID=A0A6M3K6C9_9ZZZZ
MNAVKCPVCNGNGQVSNGFYSHPGDYPYWVSSGTGTEKCQNCKGRGWLWIRDQETLDFTEPNIPLDPSLIEFYEKKGYNVCPSCGNDKNSPARTGCPPGSHYGCYCEGSCLR